MKATKFAEILESLKRQIDTHLDPVNAAFTLCPTDEEAETLTIPDEERNAALQDILSAASELQK